MTPTATGHRAYQATNDIELIQTIVRLAIEPGFVLIGPAERVFCYQPDRGRALVRPVPKYEAAAVAQLLDSRPLRTGGARTVQYGEHSGTATSVLVPKATRDMLTRWEHLRPLPGRAAQVRGPR